MKNRILLIICIKDQNDQIETAIKQVVMTKKNNRVYDKVIIRFVHKSDLAALQVRLLTITQAIANVLIVNDSGQKIHQDSAEYTIIEKIIDDNITFAKDKSIKQIAWQKVGAIETLEGWI